MRKLLLLLLSILAAPLAQAEVWQGTYGVAGVFDFKLYNADGTLDVDESDGGTEVSLSCDEGAETTATNDFVDEGNFYSISITATEMRCRRITVVVAATTTEVFFIQTNGKPGVTAEGVAQAATATTLQLAAAEAFTTDNDPVGATCIITNASTGVGQSRIIKSYVTATDTATIDSWTTTPTGTIIYQCHGSSPSSFADNSITAAVLASDAGTEIGTATWATSTRTITSLDEDSTTIDLNASYVGGLTVFDEDLTIMDINATTLGTVGTLTTLPTIPTNWLTAAGTATDFSTEVNSGMSTQASVDDLPTNAELATALGTADDAVLARLPTSLVSGRIDASVGSMQADTLTATATAASFGTEVATTMRDTVVEDQGTITLGCALAAILGYTSGDIATSGANSTYEESTGTETRITINVSSPGNRTSTITCPTY